MYLNIYVSVVAKKIRIPGVQKFRASTAVNQVLERPTRILDGGSHDGKHLSRPGKCTSSLFLVIVQYQTHEYDLTVDLAARD